MTYNAPMKALSAFGVLLFAGGITLGMIDQQQPPEVERVTSVAEMTELDKKEFQAKVASEEAKLKILNNVTVPSHPEPKIEKAKVTSKPKPAVKKVETKKVETKKVENKKVENKKVENKNTKPTTKNPVKKAEVKKVTPKKIAKKVIKKAPLKITKTAKKTIAVVPKKTSGLSAKAFAKQQIAKEGWGSSHYTCLVKLWNKESGWNHKAQNPSSGAYGIPQSLPGNKMASAGSDWKTNPHTQIKWGIDYIDGRYGSPCAAWGHSQKVGWY